MKTDAEFIPDEEFSRLSDSYVKYVLGSPERKHITIAFLNAVLKHAVLEGNEPLIIEDVEFLDREKHGVSGKSKSARFDIIARATDGRIFHIEIQVARDKYFMPRSFFYVSQDFYTQVQKGDDYSALKPVIYIGIMDFVLLGNYDHPEDWHSLHKIMNVKTHEVTLNEVEFHMIELPLLRKVIANEGIMPASELEDFLCYFGSIGGDTLMEEVAERNPMISELEALEMVYRMDPWTVRGFILDKADEQYFQKRLKEQLEKGLNRGMKRGLKQGQKTGREEGRKEGIIEGRKEGIQEGLQQGIQAGIQQGIQQGLQESNKETARRLREQGILTDEQIAQALNISVDFVKSL